MGRSPSNSVNVALLDNSTEEYRMDYSEVDIDQGEYGGRKREGTVFASIFNLINTVIGSGVLALPFAFKVCGVLLGNIFLLMVATLGATATYLLIEVAEEVEKHLPKGTSATFMHMAEAASGATLGKVVDAAVSGVCFGAMTSYIIIIADLVTPLIEVAGGPEGGFTMRLAVIAGALCVLIPLSSLRNLDGLKITSLIAICSVTYLIGVLVYEGGVSLGEDDFLDCDIGDSCLKVAEFSTDFLRTIPIICFAFTMQTSLPAIFAELKNPTKERFRTIVFVTVGVCTVVYSAAGSFGYFTFWESTQGNVLDGFEELADNVPVAIGMAGITVTVTFSFPVLAVPLFDIINDRISPVERSKKQHFAVIFAVIGVQTIIAIFVEDVSLVFGIVGATCSTTISFILPSIFYLKIMPKEEQGSFKER